MGSTLPVTPCVSFLCEAQSLPVFLPGLYPIPFFEKGTADDFVQVFYAGEDRNFFCRLRHLRQVIQGRAKSSHDLERPRPVEGNLIKSERQVIVPFRSRKNQAEPFMLVPHPTVIEITRRYSA